MEHEWTGRFMRWHCSVPPSVDRWLHGRGEVGKPANSVLCPSKDAENIAANILPQITYLNGIVMPDNDESTDSSEDDEESDEDGDGSAGVGEGDD